MKYGTQSGYIMRAYYYAVYGPSGPLAITLTKEEADAALEVLVEAYELDREDLEVERYVLPPRREQ